MHLFDKSEVIDEEFLKKQWVRNMAGIGITHTHATKEIRDLCSKMKLMIFYWTLRDDHPKDIPFGLGTYREAYLHLLSTGVNGFITEFPELCQQYICEFVGYIGDEWMILV